MSLNLDIVFGTPEYSVDMKAGAKSLQGTSDAVRCISETILNGEVPERQSHKNSVRTSLKNTFSGSYGQIFSIEIHDQALLNKFKKIGKINFVEIIAYFLSESIYQDTKILSEKSQKIVDELGDAADDLIEQLRVSSVKNMHEVSIKFDQETKLRFRNSRDNQTVLAKFNRETAKTLSAEKGKKPIDLTISVTRLNINTGNGRLQIPGESETVAFGFGAEYKVIKIEAKKIFSTNLDHNNGLDEKNWKHIKISAIPIKLKDGKVIKYIITGIYNAE